MPTKELGLNRFDSLEQWHAALFPGCNCPSVCRIKPLACDNVLNGKRTKRHLFYYRDMTINASAIIPDE